MQIVGTNGDAFTLLLVYTDADIQCSADEGRRGLLTNHDEIVALVARVGLKPLATPHTQKLNTKVHQHHIARLGSLLDQPGK